MASGVMVEESKALLWLHALVGCARGDKVDANWLERLNLVTSYSEKTLDWLLDTLATSESGGEKARLGILASLAEGWSVEKRLHHLHRVWVWSMRWGYHSNEEAVIILRSAHAWGVEEAFLRDFW